MVVALAVTLVCVLGGLAFMLWPRQARHAEVVVRDDSLRGLPLYFYRAASPLSDHPRAMLFFFGNDVGFWQAHEAIAEREADAGIAVAGFDVRKWMQSIPDDSAHRWQAFTHTLPNLIQRARHELSADCAPLVLGGHSLGAELALWTAAYDSLPDVAGVLALGPGERGHLRVTVGDMAELEPTEAGSFALADVIARIPLRERIAIVRGASDPLGHADVEFARRGGDRLNRFVIPLAGHSLRRLIIAGPRISSALEFLLRH